MGRLFSTRVPRPFNGERGRNKDKVINYERILINLISFGKKKWLENIKKNETITQINQVNSQSLKKLQPHIQV